MPRDFDRQLNVLIVENNLIDNKMLKGMLGKTPYGSFVYRNCDSLAGAFPLLSDNSFDVVLLDLNLQDSSGLDTLTAVHNRFPDVAIVVNTGAYEDDLGLQAVTRGAQDYLIKGKYSPYGLAKSLYYALERKKAEQELKAAYNRLKETQAQLIEIAKINVVGGLASGIAHEVKNPLATILYGVEYLVARLEQPDEKIALTLDSIKEAANKANQIIRDLLDFANLSILEKQSEDLNAVIEQSLNLISHQCEAAGIAIVRDFQADLPAVDIARNRVEQVLLDLILNAINAIGDGGTLTIRTHRRLFEAADADGAAAAREKSLNPGDPVVVVDIEDTGPGIKEEHLAKVFDPFFTTRRASGGIGLGLSIARTIMTNHQGYIKLFNLQPKGARARLIFPAPAKA